jgi:iron complex outermembrane recepter protein
MDLHLMRNMSVGIAALLVLSTAATAQEAASKPPSGAEAPAKAEGGIEEVVVTAQRRSESAMGIPLAVTAFSQADLAALGVSKSSELVGLVPTLQVNSAFGDVQPNFSLRGIGLTNEHNPNQASPVGIYIDDAYISARAAQGLQLFDLSRIEVLRGPQGTLYGRNTTGGAINFISRMPSLHGSEGNVEVGYGSFNTFTAEGAFETALSEGVSGVRVAFNYARGNGFIQDIYPSQPASNSTDSVAARLIYKIKPNDRLDIMFKWSGDNAQPTQAGVYDLGTGGVNGRPADYNSVLDYSRQEHGLSFWQIDSARLGYNLVRNNGAELIIKYDINDQLALTSLTSYNLSNAEFTQEGTGVASTVLVQPLDTLYGNKFTMLNQELRLSYAGERTKLQTGLYYGYDKDASNSYYWLFDGGADIHQYFDQTRKSSALFAQLDQSLTKKFAMTLGLRYTMDKATYDNYYSYITPGSESYTGQRNTGAQYWDPAPPAPAPASAFFLGSSYNAATGQFISGPAYHLDNNAVTGRFALNYTFDDGQILYASYNRGYRNAAFCGQCFANAKLDITEPETDDAYEVGTKGFFFNRKLQITADVFSIKYRNQQTNQQIGLQSILTNVPKSSMKGVEVEATAQPTPDFRVSLSVGYLDAIYDKLTLGLATVDGSKQPYAPKTTVNFHFDWHFAHVGDGVYTFTPSVIYASDVFFSPYNNLAGNGPLSQPANTKINAQVSYDTSKYSVTLWTKNLTNKETFGDGLDLRTFGFYYMIPLPPRTYGLTFGMKF